MSWRDCVPAASGTHHVVCDRPAYEARFDEVLKFHEPGLAPVRRGDLAWHIDANGSAAYANRYRRTFGFYEGLAAVVADYGWHHIGVNGFVAYVVAHAWCGNFQEGRCAVRRHDGTYVHITADGRPAYAHAWRYAGDYRDGRAVVQASDGLSTHIDGAGQLAHARWFLDLDVFHKGFARARDAGGWMHIERAGRPLYATRFASVEPFYNGQARVECFDGALEIIDERGETVGQLREPQR